MNKFVWAALIASVLLAGCAGDRFQTAKDDCAASSSYITVGDDGDSMLLDGDGDDSSGASTSDIVCVLTALEVPDHVLDRMGQTRALDGMQEASWDGLTASWTYHPNNGLDVILAEA